MQPSFGLMQWFYIFTQVNKKRMKKLIIFFIAVFSCLLSVNAQNTFIDCSPNVFYALGWGNYNVYKLSKTATTVTVDSVIINQGSGAQLGLGIASLSGSKRFYSAGSSTGFSYNVLEYSSNTWNSIFTNAYPNYFANVGAYGNSIYFQRIATVSDPHNKIYRFNSGILSLIWEDSTMFNNIADLAVDTLGSIYIFTGSQFSTIDTLRVLSPNGIQLAKYPISFNSYYSYGMFIEDSTIYVGLGPGNLQFPNTLLPVNIVNGQAVLGTPIPVPHPIIGGTIGSPTYLEFSDLASCNGGVVTNIEPTGIKELLSSQYAMAYPVPCKNELNVSGFFNHNSYAQVFDMTGRKCMQKNISPGDKLDVHTLLPGMYILNIENKAILKFMVE